MPARNTSLAPDLTATPSPSRIPVSPCPASARVTRRTLLRLLSGSALALASGSILTGCGGGGGGGGGSNGGGSNSPSRTLSGSINPSQIGGSSLLVQSAYQTNVTAGSGHFSIKVSAQGAQVVLATDSGNQARGLAITVPQTSTATIDATSTALALVFLTPGILATDPTIAAQRLSQIAALLSFAPIVTFLTSNLPTNALAPLLQGASLSGLVYTCVTDWLSTNKGNVKRSNVSDGFGFSVTPGSIANLSVVPATLSNQELRSLSVVRRYVDGNGNDTGTPQVVLAAFNGGQNLSLTDLLTSGSATTASDTANLSGATTAAVQYWVRGPGSSTSSQTLPASITSSDSDAWVVSALIDLLVPLLQCVLGLSGTYTSAQAFQDITTVWEQNNTSPNITQIINDFAAKNVQNAGTDLVKILLGPLANDAALVQALLPVLAQDLTGASSQSFVASQILDVFGLLSTVFSDTTCVGVVNTWLALPHVSSVTLSVSNGGITVS